MIPLAVRKAGIGDMNFILATWLRDVEPDPRITKEVKFEGYQDRVKIAISRSELTVLCNPEDITQIYAWACHDERSLHYLFVKSAVRQCGLSKVLLTKLGRRPTHTNISSMIKFLHLQSQFNPYAL